jgi:hypothetical protein
MVAASWREQYERLGRWHARLAEAPDVGIRQADDFYAFFVTCYHLKDWIKNDNAVEEKTRPRVEAFVSTSDPLGLSGDIANGFKHLTRTKPARIDPAAHVSVVSYVLGQFRLGMGQLGASSAIVIAGDQGWRYAKEVADFCLNAWKEFLQQEGLL